MVFSIVSIYNLAIRLVWLFNYFLFFFLERFGFHLELGTRQRFTSFAKKKRLQDLHLQDIWYLQVNLRKFTCVRLKNHIEEMALASA